MKPEEPGPACDKIFDAAFERFYNNGERELARMEAERDNPCTPGENLTDNGNSRRFARQHGEVIRYCKLREKWLVWTGMRWEWDQIDAAMAAAKRTVRSIYSEAAIETNKDRREALGEHAWKSENDAKIRAMLNLAKAEVPVKLSELDQHPHLFNCQNGIINLKTRELIPHDSRSMLTKLSPVPYDTDAPCNNFVDFLTEAMAGNNKLIEWLKVWFGYCLTGEVRQHALVFFHGTGGNGKTTLLETIAHVCGDYAGVAAPGLLMKKHYEQHSTDIADLFGKRFVTSVETKKGLAFDESRVKWLTGGDRLKARFMRGDFFEFDATHKFTIAANHKPPVYDDTVAFWRRMMMVPFNVKIPDDKRDLWLDHKLEPEAAGILAWMVEGAAHWYKYQLPDLPEISEATRKYKAEQDWIQPFLAEHTEPTTDGKNEIQVNSLYEKYKAWSNEGGEKPVSRKTLSRLLEERGLRNEQSTGDKKYYWKGLALKS